jgi:hypothetical protein
MKMGIVRLFLAATLVAGASTAALAQPEERKLTPLETAVACAPPTSFDMPADGLRVMASQDTVDRLVFGEKDLLVLSGGTNAGVALGQRYFIRRPIYFGTSRANKKTRPQGMLTPGWIRVVAVNDATAIASIEHFCSAIYPGDALEPFTPPSVPADADRDMPTGRPDFSDLGRVLFGVENVSTGGANDLMLIDRGSEQGVTAGARFAVYRDVRTPGAPLSSVGEGVVVSIGKTMSLARITRSRDAIISGDYVVPRK